MESYCRRFFPQPPVRTKCLSWYNLIIQFTSDHKNVIGCNNCQKYFALIVASHECSNNCALQQSRERPPMWHGRRSLDGLFPGERQRCRCITCERVKQISDLILSERSERLEGWPRKTRSQPRHKLRARGHPSRLALRARLRMRAFIASQAHRRAGCVAPPAHASTLMAARCRRPSARWSGVTGMRRAERRLRPASCATAMTRRPSMTLAGPCIQIRRSTPAVREAAPVWPPARGLVVGAAATQRRASAAGRARASIRRVSEPA